MSALKAFLGMMMIFLMGIMTGAVGIHYLEGRRVRQAFESPQKLSFYIVGHVSKELRLDPGQEARLREVVRSSREKLREIRSESAPRVEKVFMETEKSILSFLRPEQEMKFQKMIERRKGFFHHLREEKI